MYTVSQNPARTFEHEHSRGWAGQIGTAVHGDASWSDSHYGFKWNTIVWIMGSSDSDKFEIALEGEPSIDDLANLWVACVAATPNSPFTDALDGAAS